MNSAVLNVIRFGASDVIATSLVNGRTYQPRGLMDTTANNATLYDTVTGEEVSALTDFNDVHLCWQDIGRGYVSTLTDLDSKGKAPGNAAMYADTINWVYKADTETAKSKGTFHIDCKQ